MSTDNYIFVQYKFYPQDNTFVDMDSWAASNLSADELIEYNAAKENQNSRQHLIDSGIIVAHRDRDVDGVQTTNNYTTIDPPEGIVVRRRPLENNSSEETWVSQAAYDNNQDVTDSGWHNYFQRWLTETNQRFEKIIRDNLPT